MIKPIIQGTLILILGGLSTWSVDWGYNYFFNKFGMEVSLNDSIYPAKLDQAFALISIRNIGPRPLTNVTVIIFAGNIILSGKPKESTAASNAYGDSPDMQDFRNGRIRFRFTRLLPGDRIIAVLNIQKGSRVLPNSIKISSTETGILADNQILYQK